MSFTEQSIIKTTAADNVNISVYLTKKQEKCKQMKNLTLENCFYLKICS